MSKPATTLVKTQNTPQTTYSPEQIYKLFIEFYVTPPSERTSKGIPHDTEHFCKRYGIDRAYIATYLDNPTYYADVYEQSTNWAKSKTPILLHAYFNKVMADMKAEDVREWRQLVYENDKEMNKDKGAQYIQNNFFNVDERQYEQIVRREAKRLASGGQE